MLNRFWREYGSSEFRITFKEFVEAGELGTGAIRTGSMATRLAEPSFAALAKKLAKLPDEGAAFLRDFANASEEVVEAFGRNPGLVDGWKVLHDANVPASLKHNLLRLRQVDNYLKSNPGTESAIKKALDDVGNNQEDFLNGINNATKEVDYLSGRSAFPDEIADAVTRIKQHRIDIDKKYGKNYGYVEGEVNGSAVDNRIWSSGEAKPDVEPQIFDAFEVEGASGQSWLRNTDSEYKMLNQLAHDLGGVKGKVYPKVNGTLRIVSENPYCTSCQGVIQQFNKMFPNINLVLVHGVR